MRKVYDKKLFILPEGIEINEENKQFERFQDVEGFLYMNPL